MQYIRYGKLRVLAERTGVNQLNCSILLKKANASATFTKDAIITDLKLISYHFGPRFIADQRKSRTHKIAESVFIQNRISGLKSIGTHLKHYRFYFNNQRITCIFCTAAGLPGVVMRSR